MAALLIKKRRRFFMAVEGESEQSFVAWLQNLSAQKDLHIHLDSMVLGGGGFEKMLEIAVREHRRQSLKFGKYQDRFLIVDADRAQSGDWPVEKLKTEAARHQFTVCLQKPNHEGLLFRMMAGRERENPTASAAVTKLKSHWPHYRKPVNAQDLARQFSLTDLLRIASVDPDWEILLMKLGF